MADTEPAPKRGRPVTTGTTPHRTIRVTDELWNAALAAAQARGETVTAVIERALERYVRDHERRGGGR